MAGLARLLSLAVLLVAPVAAQQYRANLRGTVWNPDGSAATGVPFVIVSEATGEARHFESGADGRYAVSGLLPGEYRIEARDQAHRGFAIRTKVAVAESRDLDLRLANVSITASADVRGTFVPIDRQTPALTTRLDGTFLTNLPFDGRNFLDVPLMAPGLVPGQFGIASNGLADRFTAYLVDGIYDIDPRLGLPAVRPQLDTIEEVDIRRAMFGASFGRTAGAQVNIISRSGTNQPAGGAFGFFRTDADRAQVGGFGGGPLVEDRTFAFGSYQFSGRDDSLRRTDDSQLLAARLDQLVAGSSHLSARYALDAGELRDRRGQNAGASVHTGRGSVANELRAGFTRIAFGDGDRRGLESLTYQLSDAATWTQGAHLVSAGLEWYGAKRDLDADELTGTAWGMFVEDEWRASSSLSIDAGVRFDRPDEAEDAGRANHVSPRAGFAWAADREATTVLRGGYGLYRNYTTFNVLAPRVDGWSLGVQRQVGRGRSFEATYLGNRSDDAAPDIERSRYNALQATFQQRSETGITAVVAYAYGKWTETPRHDEDAVRSAFDSRHAVRASFVAALPFGKDRRLFSRGMAAKILGDIEVSGILTLRSGLPAIGDEERGPTYRNVDAALLKNLAIGGGRTLQLRAETFNLSDRRDTGPGRRYQFGGRVLF